MAVLNIRKGQNFIFEKQFGEARKILSAMKGYRNHELLNCIGNQDKYMLIVRWDTLGDHMEGFRKHAQYQVWKSLLHSFYDPFPEVEHYVTIY